MSRFTDRYVSRIEHNTKLSEKIADLRVANTRNSQLYRNLAEARRVGNLNFVRGAFAGVLCGLALAAVYVTVLM